jgi:hypothetical protein
VRHDTGVYVKERSKKTSISNQCSKSLGPDMNPEAEFQLPNFGAQGGP